MHVAHTHRHTHCVRTHLAGQGALSAHALAVVEVFLERSSLLVLGHRVVLLNLFVERQVRLLLLGLLDRRRRLGVSSYKQKQTAKNALGDGMDGGKKSARFLRQSFGQLP